MFSKDLDLKENSLQHEQQFDLQTHQGRIERIRNNELIVPAKVVKNRLSNAKSPFIEKEQYNDFSIPADISNHDLLPKPRSIYLTVPSKKSKVSSISAMESVDLSALEEIELEAPSSLQCRILFPIWQYMVDSSLFIFHKNSRIRKFCFKLTESSEALIRIEK